MKRNHGAIAPVVLIATFLTLLGCDNKNEAPKAGKEDLTATSTPQVASTTAPAPGAMEACSLIKEDPVRLRCYDKATGVGKQDSVEQASGWVIENSEDPLTGEAVFVAAMPSTEKVGRYGKSVTLIVRCKGKDLDLFINWSDYLGNDDPVVSTRFDSEPMEKKEWNQSSDNSSAFSKSPRSFTERLAKSSKFVAQVSPYNESPSTAIFDTANSSEVLAPALACGQPS